ncbi:nuclear transport factor 2 family protein [Nannocystis punicea]|uniref:Nuclear transport factor 2 family protein n=1 Tax=Nannocystis punicea TaxID=2995304 RepID=A0ABY7H5M9_9BACT|nr:nuclear transport factor 2 family protein [Nannocystis poenicansa]WAS94587.1 nuclear transport factor 2 family protein [Nannocystis poenicansa]
MTNDSANVQTIEDCARQSHAGTIDFGTVVTRLAAAGVESYHVDYRVGRTTYYTAAGQVHTFELHLQEPAIAAEFDGAAVQAAVRGAQQGEVKYPEFVRRTRAAGCVGYDVWIAGRHVVYHGRRGERHVEHFPGGPAGRDNVEVVKQVYAAFGRRDLAAVLALYAADVQIDQSPEVPWGDHYEGHAGAQAFFARLLQAVDSTLALERFIDAGEHVVALGRTRGVLRASGHRFDVPIAHVWQIRDGLVVRIRYCIDNPTMLAAMS